MMRNRINGLLLIVIVIVVAVAFFSLRQEAAADQAGRFEGTWTASGKWEPLPFKKGREVFTFKLSGHVNLENEIGETKDFWSECIGLWDSGTGGTTRCVWRDLDGNDAAFIVLGGQLGKENIRVAGEFVGGEGVLNGLTGTLSFTWSSLYRNETDRILTGHTKDLTGSYRIAGNEK